MTGTAPMVELRNIDLRYFTLDGETEAVCGFSLAVSPGEFVAIVGQSGCGKSTLGKAIARLYKPTGGSIHFQGTNLAGLSRGKLKPFRREIQMIFQDPYSSLNPRMTVENIIGEPLKVHNIAKGKKCTERVQELLNLVGLNQSLWGAEY